MASTSILLMAISHSFSNNTLLYLHRHILVHPDGWAADNDPTALNYFDALVDWQPIPVG